MSRKRYISTDISTDIKLAELSERGFLPLILYTWSIPHMDDWGRITGDSRQFKLLVCPALDVTSKDVDESLDQIAAVGLWNRYEVEGKQTICIPEESWFKHQSYINKAKRGNDSGSNFKSPQNAEEHRKTPKNTEEQQESPQNAVSFSLSSSFSSSSSKESSSGIGMRVTNPFGLFEKHEFGKLNETTAQFIEDCIKTYTEDWVKRAMTESIKHDKKVWAYVEGILKRWKASGHPEPWTLEKEEPKQQQSFRGKYSKPQSPRLNVVKDDGNTPEVTPEQLEEMLELARKLKDESTLNQGA